MRYNTLHRMSKVVMANVDVLSEVLKLHRSDQMQSVIKTSELDSTVPEWQAHCHCSDRGRSSKAMALSRGKCSPRPSCYQDHMTEVG